MNQKQLLFQFKDNLYKYKFLLDGLTSAPRNFSKTLKSVLPAFRKEGHQMMDYLDDTSRYPKGSESNEGANYKNTCKINCQN